MWATASTSPSVTAPTIAAQVAGDDLDAVPASRSAQLAGGGDGVDAGDPADPRMRGEAGGQVRAEVPADAGHQDVHLRLPVTERRWAWRARGAARTSGRARPAYLPRRRRWTRVLRSSLRCFFLAIRLRRFLTTEPIRLSPRVNVRHGPAAKRLERPSRMLPSDPDRSAHPIVCV